MARTYSCFGKGLEAMLGGEWLGCWWWDRVRAVLGQDQFWLFSAQPLFLGSFHTWLHNSLWGQWDCCRALMDGTRLWHFCHGMRMGR